MKVALVAESFLPHYNGVTTSLLRLIDYLGERGHQALVITPTPGGRDGPSRYGIAQVAHVPSMPLPTYHDVRVTLAGARRIGRMLREFNPDVVHLASPFFLGWTATKAAARQGLPTVAVYQTEVPSYLERYNAAWGEPLLWAWVRRIHRRATMTLAPSTYARRQLEMLGVGHIHVWGRGVDASHFDPARRDRELRQRFAPRGEVIVGYVGRLAKEKQVHDLQALAAVPGISVVVVGDGPLRTELERALPNAHFAGFKTGDQLARYYASMDIFVHTGELETFGQTIQEAHASGLPVIAPRRGGPMDLVEHGVTGYLYAPGHLRELAHFVRELCDHPRIRSRMATAARLAVLGRTWDKTCDQLMDYYALATQGHLAAGLPAPAER